MEPFSTAARFPARRRVTQACIACRMRKTRCDAAQPRCGFCALHNMDCVYRDSQQPRIDYNTQVLLERMQLLEDRLLSTKSPNNLPTEKPPHPPSQSHGPLATELEIHVPGSHTANANHVYSWPIVQQLLSETVTELPEQRQNDVTDVFFRQSATTTEPPPASWRLYTDTTMSISQHRQLIHAYFTQVNVFFPLLSAADVLRIHEAVAAEDSDISKQNESTVSTAQYALLLLVLCMACFMEQGHNLVPLEGPVNRPCTSEEDLLWSKARLLLGSISGELTLVAAQCTMLAWFVGSSSTR